MEVLKRRAGAVRAPPMTRMALDPSLSLSFQLPTTMRLPTPPNKPIPTLDRTPPVEKMETREEEDDSWETKDWSEPAATAAAVEEARAARRVVDTNMVLCTTDELTDDADAWEEADAPVLPDDFPLLIVNLSRLRDLHFRSDSGTAAIPMDTDDALRAFYGTVKTTLHAHFTQMTEVLFDQQVCFHTHYGAQRRVLENLHRVYPSDVFALVDYPVELNGLDLHEYLDVLSSPTRWASMNYLKDCLRKCSRDLEWKFEVALELEKLAQQEHDWWTREQQRRSDEIDSLTRLRESFREKLRLTTDETAKTTSKASAVMLLRKLEDLETRLVALIDVFLKEPELTPRERRELVGMTDAAPAMQMRNVLDMVVAMIFSRLPRDYGAQPTTEAHFEMLVDHHVHIRRLWKKDFGRLPVRTNGGDEEEEEEEEEEEVARPIEEDFDQLCHVTDDNVDERSDGWEALDGGMDEVNDDEAETVVNGVVTPAADGFDGYGADNDSDGSDSDEEEGNAVDTSPPKPSAKRVVQRTRRTKQVPSFSVARDRSPSPVADKLARQSERERALEAFMYGGSGDSGSDEDHGGGGRLVQSYARTGALQLLRRAKENEGF
jgi:hypothetical protein